MIYEFIASTPFAAPSIYGTYAVGLGKKRGGKRDGREGIIRKFWLNGERAHRTSQGFASAE